MLLHEWKLDTAVAYAEERGEERGMAEGGRKRAIQIAQKLKNEGLDASTIARTTDLTIEEILKL